MANDFLVFIFLAVLVAVILWFSKKFEKNPVFKYFPAPLWCYFLPMIASWAGLISREAAVYPAISKHLLPACLIMLLMSAHLKKAWKLGPAALASMAVGSAVIILGGPLLFLIFRPWLPEDAWMGLGSLSASWTGGSANMIAVKEAIGVPEPIFSVMVIVDSIVAYVWMAFVMELAPWQERFDQWNHAKMGMLYKMGSGNLDLGSGSKLAPRSRILVPFLIAFTFGELSILLATQLGGKLTFINASTWAVILATLIGIVLSLKRIKNLDEKMTEKTGYFLLYLLIASIGARADLTGIFKTPIFLLFGFAWVILMGLALFIFGKIFRIPLFFLSTASQANVGGTASATIIAAVYQPHLAFVGLLLAVLGNVFGTYLGIGCSYLMRWITQSY